MQMDRNLRALRPGGGRWLDIAILAAGAAVGVAVALSLDEAELAGIGDRLGTYLLAPLIAAANAGIACF